ncbi:MAG TPA: hypothetical protein PLR41_14005 [Alphaproteobacteria bacterium]|nr:hypothetical protein [Alphaproteobacteria bacterium]
MQDIPRAILLPPPSPPPNRNGARTATAADQALPDEVGRGTRTGSAAPAGFLTLVETTPEDRVEFTGDFRGKQFRFRPYNNRGGAERTTADNTIERPAADAGEADSAADPNVAADVLDGYGAGANSRNSTAFLATFIAQERLSDGLYNPQYAEASDAYRRAGGSPPTGENQRPLVSFAA